MSWRRLSRNFKSYKAICNAMEKKVKYKKELKELQALTAKEANESKEPREAKASQEKEKKIEGCQERSQSCITR